MCLYPKIIQNKKYTANKKNEGRVPRLPIKEMWIEGEDRETGEIKIKYDRRVQSVAVGCGKCMECQKKRATGWKIRLLEEVRANKLKAYFVTLTFSNESIAELGSEVGTTGYNRDNDIAKLAVKRFLERWRKKHKRSVRHWLVTELGHKGTENIHLHGVIWTDKGKEEIVKRWAYGFADTGKFVNESTISYITKYITKVDIQHREYNPRILTSPGIGSGYIKREDAKRNKYKGEETKETYTTRTGHQMGMPTYYRNAIYNDKEREKLWLKLLDENKRYVLGKQIDISKGEEIYYKKLEEARKLNKQLGYGDDSINWDRKQYENNRRNMLYYERIKGIKDGGDNENNGNSEGQ